MVGSSVAVDVRGVAVVGFSSVAGLCRGVVVGMLGAHPLPVQKGGITTDVEEPSIDREV